MSTEKNVNGPGTDQWVYNQQTVFTSCFNQTTQAFLSLAAASERSAWKSSCCYQLLGPLKQTLCCRSSPPASQPPSSQSWWRSCKSGLRSVTFSNDYGAPGLHPWARGAQLNMAHACKWMRNELPEVSDVTHDGSVRRRNGWFWKNLAPPQHCTSPPSESFSWLFAEPVDHLWKSLRMFFFFDDLKKQISVLRSNCI